MKIFKNTILIVILFCAKSYLYASAASAPLTKDQEIKIYQEIKKAALEAKKNPTGRPPLIKDFRSDLNRLKLPRTHEFLTLIRRFDSAIANRQNIDARYKELIDYIDGTHPTLAKSMITSTSPTASRLLSARPTSPAAPRPAPQPAAASSAKPVDPKKDKEVKEGKEIKEAKERKNVFYYPMLTRILADMRKNNSSKELIKWLDINPERIKVIHHHGHSLVFIVLEKLAGPNRRKTFDILIRRNVAATLIDLENILLAFSDPEKTYYINKVLDNLLQQGISTEDLVLFAQNIQTEMGYDPILQIENAPFFERIKTMAELRAKTTRKTLASSLPEDLLAEALAPSDPRILAFKHAIEDFKYVYHKPLAEQVEGTKSITNLDQALNMFENLIVQTNDKRDKPIKIILQDKTGYTPLLYAVYLNKIHAVKYLVAQMKNYIVKKNNLKNQAQNEIKKQLDALHTLQNERISLTKTDEETAKNVDRVVKIDAEIKKINKSIEEENEKIINLGPYQDIFTAKTINGLNAHCLAVFLEYKEIAEFLSPEFSKEDKVCPK